MRDRYRYGTVLGARLQDASREDELDPMPPIGAPATSGVLNRSPTPARGAAHALGVDLHQACAPTRRMAALGAGGKLNTHLHSRSGERSMAQRQEALFRRIEPVIGDSRRIAAARCLQKLEVPAGTRLFDDLLAVLDTESIRS